MTFIDKGGRKENFRNIFSGSVAHNLKSIIYPFFFVLLTTGQEEGDVGYDEGITITPFNMREELEEGHFDKDGTYIFAKEVNKALTIRRL